MIQTYKSQMQRLAEEIVKYPWESEQFYAEYLAQTYFFVRHSTRLLALAGARCDAATRNSLHLRFLKHASEEKNHELVVLKDLMALGYRIEEYNEAASTKALYATQFYNIDYISPESFFGYIFALEGVAIEAFPNVLSRIEASHGSKACKFLKLHIAEDPGHINDAIKATENISGPIQDVIVNNIVSSCEHYSAVLNDIERRWAKKYNLEVKRTA